jgi:hypothetical protein
MTEDTNAPAAQPGEQPHAPETPALVEHVEAIAEGAAKQEAGAIAAAATSRADAVIAEFEAWIVERLYNSPLTRATGAWNHFISEAESFKARIKALI